MAAVRGRGALVLALVPVLLTALVDRASGEDNAVWHDHIVLGAGPGGLQAAYLLHKASADYVVLERAGAAGSFFAKFPRHRKLISINKRFMDRPWDDEFALRHDWNSLLNDEGLRFAQYTTDYFPHADAYVRYLNDFAASNRLNIAYGTNVTRVARATGDDDDHQQQQQHRQQFELHATVGGERATFRCRFLFVATGTWKPVVPDAEGIELAVGYEDMEVDPAGYEGQNVLIIGAGNSALETADALTSTTGRVHVFARHAPRFAWQSHYVGDLRAVNNNFFDTYQLKSLNGITSLPSFVLDRVESGKIVLRGARGVEVARGGEYDTVIRATGFRFDDSIFHDTVGGVGPGKGAKHPPTNAWYESANVPNLYVAGTAMHANDYRKSAGGFVHGFRYLVRTMVNAHLARHLGVPWPAARVVPRRPEDIARAVLARVNTASGPYQMFGVLGDVLVLNRTHAVLYAEVSLAGLSGDGDDLVALFPEIAAADAIVTWHFDYGHGTNADNPNVFANNVCTSPSCAKDSEFLHPIVRYLARADGFAVRDDSELHITEDFVTQWDSARLHERPLVLFLETMEGLRARQEPPAWYDDPSGLPAAAGGTGTPHGEDALADKRNTHVGSHQRGAWHFSTACSPGRQACRGDGGGVVPADRGCGVAVVDDVVASAQEVVALRRVVERFTTKLRAGDPVLVADLFEGSLHTPSDGTLEIARLQQQAGDRQPPNLGLFHHVLDRVQEIVSAQFLRGGRAFVASPTVLVSVRTSENGDDLASNNPLQRWLDAGDQKNLCFAAVLFLTNGPQPTLQLETTHDSVRVLPKVGRLVLFSSPGQEVTGTVAAAPPVGQFDAIVMHFTTNEQHAMPTTPSRACEDLGFCDAKQTVAHVPGSGA